MKYRTFISIALLNIFCSQVAHSSEFKSPEIFILGDSQLQFGSGPAFQDFFSNIHEQCGHNPYFNEVTKSLNNAPTGVLGVGSTSLNSWTRRDDASKKRICTDNPKWVLNASTFGTLKYTHKNFLEIGQKEPFHFCKQDRSAFEMMFDNQFYDPKLFVMFFLGNSSKRWATSLEDAKEDVIQAMQQIPAGMPCVFMTTAPPYHQRMIEKRYNGQNNLRKAFQDVGSRCSFVSGLTPETINVNVANDDNFKFNVKAGKVKDPFHPNAKAAKIFLNLKRKNICRAVLEQFEIKGGYKGGQTLPKG